MSCGRRLIKSKHAMAHWRSSMKGVIREAATGAKGQAPAKSAAEDVLCQAAMSGMMMDSLVDHFASLEDALLQLPEVTR